MVTDCEVCRYAELSRGQKVWEWLKSLGEPYGTSAIIKHQAEGMRGLVAAMTGRAIVEPDFYALHKERFEQTGDELELLRMLRHVKQ